VIEIITVQFFNNWLSKEKIDNLSFHHANTTQMNLRLNSELKQLKAVFDCIAQVRKSIADAHTIREDLLFDECPFLEALQQEHDTLSKSKSIAVPERCLSVERVVDSSPNESSRFFGN